MGNDFEFYEGHDYVAKSRCHALRAGEVMFPARCTKDLDHPPPHRSATTAFFPPEEWTDDE